MNQQLPDQNKTPQAEESGAARTAWRRPHMQKLRLSLDTASSVGSGSDGNGRPTGGGGVPDLTSFVD